MIGISCDDFKTQCDFAKLVSAGYPMVADQDGKIARAFDVLWPFFKIARRVTFFLDEEGVVRAVFAHEFQVNKHRDEVMVAVERHVKKKALSAAPA